MGIPEFKTPVISGLSYDGNTCTFTAAFDNIPYTVDLISVLYDRNGAISGISQTEATSSVAEKTITVSGENAKTVKVFIWNSLTGMRPLCNAAEADIALK